MSRPHHREEFIEHRPGLTRTVGLGQLHSRQTCPIVLSDRLARAKLRSLPLTRQSPIKVDSDLGSIDASQAAAETPPVEVRPITA
jgi:hypothetical protein